MERAYIDVRGLMWDTRNEAKLAAHGVEPEEIEDVLDSEPRFFVNAPGRAAEYIMLAPDFNGRFFFAPIIPTSQQGIWYVVTAYRLERRRALRIYERGH